MNYKFYTSSKKAWEGMYNAIKEAKNSIYLEIYIFQNDMEKYNFFELLIKKAKEGVKVYLVLDYLGSFKLSHEEIEELRKSEIEVLLASSFLHRIHRKILIIDENVAFIGGVNFHQNTFNWKDLVVRIENKRLIKRITYSFIKVYNSLGGESLELKKAENKTKVLKSKLKRTKAWMIEHIPAFSKYSLKKFYKEELENAKEKVIIVTPYFAPKIWLRKKLKEIIKKGIIVEVLIPSKVDLFVADRANYFYMHKLSPFGISFYIEPYMNHAKAILIDDKRAMVGSQNIDFLSFDFNSEIGVFFNEKEPVLQLNKIVKMWKGESTNFNLKEHNLIWYDYLLSPLMMLFSKIF